MFGMGAWELTIVFAIVLVLFGAKRLPQVATGLGQAIRNFRTAIKETNSSEEEQLLERENEEKHGTKEIKK